LFEVENYIHCLSESGSHDGIIEHAIYWSTSFVLGHLILFEFVNSKIDMWLKPVN
ncbi:20764_t:CDS:1, partial [Gigaspora margarita]